MSHVVWPMARSRIRVAVIGSGNIGIDLCERLLRDEDFEVVAVIGRRADSPGLLRFEERVPFVISGGLDDFLPQIDLIDGVFDATSAFDHERHWNEMEARGKWIIDLTPSRLGVPIVPSLIGKAGFMQIQSGRNAADYSMVTCGGQSSAPLLFAVAVNSRGIEEVEVSSSIAALSAGPATRLNIDQYIASTEHLATLITGCLNAKAILVLNPADPPVMMRTTVTVQAEAIDLDAVTRDCATIVSEVEKSVPGYTVVVAPHSLSSRQLVITAKVTGAGYYLPEFAGNLDIINAAAVETARRHAKAQRAAEILP
jgi:acetaldehyde dehydrogenase (acetylating)